MRDVKPEKGQGLIEYAFILVLVALVVLVILLTFGPAIGNAFSGINTQLEDITYQMLLC